MKPAASMVVRLALGALALAGFTRSSQVTAPHPFRSGDPSPVAGNGTGAGRARVRGFVAGSDNPFFPLVPGTRFRYRSETADGTETEDVFVTHETRRIDDTTLVMVVRDVTRLDGKVTESTKDLYASDAIGNVWYFGEHTRHIDPETGAVTEDGWQAGVDGAKAGIIMEAHPAVGDMYNEEDAPGTAQDQAKVLAVDAAASVPVDDFSGCLQTANTSPLEPGALEHKFYAPGVGLVLEIDVEAGNVRNELVRVTRSRGGDQDPGDDDDDWNRGRGHRRGSGDRAVSGPAPVRR